MALTDIEHDARELAGWLWDEIVRLEMMNPLREHEYVVRWAETAHHEREITTIAIENMLKEMRRREASKWR